MPRKGEKRERQAERVRRKKERQELEKERNERKRQIRRERRGIVSHQSVCSQLGFDFHTLFKNTKLRALKKSSQISFLIEMGS